MKKTLVYAALMIIVIIILPLIIVKGCSFMSTTGVDEKKQASGIKIKVFFYTSNETKEMDLEEYLDGVVAAEMPADFEPQALKAQAIAARTYAYGRFKKIYISKDDVHRDADICTNPAHCQAWVSKDAKMKEWRGKWGNLVAERNWNKIVTAVLETKNIILTYDNKIINPVFHSNSGGRTENSEDVWEGNPVPYLRSVLSPGEEVSTEFKNSVTVKVKDFYDIVKNKYPDVAFKAKDGIDDIEIIDYSVGGRVKNIKVGDIIIKGTDFRELFTLRSANFKIEEEGNDALKITVYGYGHGVGMSQWGANNLAKNGGSYEEILKYYYTGVQLAAISN